MPVALSEVWFGKGASSLVGSQTQDHKLFFPVLLSMETGWRREVRTGQGLKVQVRAESGGADGRVVPGAWSCRQGGRCSHCSLGCQLIGQQLRSFM